MGLTITFAQGALDTLNPKQQKQLEKLAHAGNQNLLIKAIADLDLREASNLIHNGARLPKNAAQILAESAKTKKVSATALLEGAIKSENEQLVKLTLDAFTDLIPEPAYLEMVIKNHTNQSVRQFLNRGSNVNSNGTIEVWNSPKKQFGPKKVSMLMVAVTEYNSKAVALLLEHGAKINPNEKQSLYIYACKKRQDDKTVKMLEEYAPLTPEEEKNVIIQSIKNIDEHIDKDHVKALLHLIKNSSDDAFAMVMAQITLDNLNNLLRQGKDKEQISEQYLGYVNFRSITPLTEALRDRTEEFMKAHTPKPAPASTSGAPPPSDLTP
jgi:hypothetical protein